jgi:hypothetical protein
MRNTVGKSSLLQDEEEISKIKKREGKKSIAASSFFSQLPILVQYLPAIRVKPLILTMGSGQMVYTTVFTMFSCNKTMISAFVAKSTVSSLRCGTARSFPFIYQTFYNAMLGAC